MDKSKVLLVLNTQKTKKQEAMVFRYFNDNCRQEFLLGLGVAFDARHQEFKHYLVSEQIEEVQYISKVIAGFGFAVVKGICDAVGVRCVEKMRPTLDKLWLAEYTENPQLLPPCNLNILEPIFGVEMATTGGALVLEGLGCKKEVELPCTKGDLLLYQYKHLLVNLNYSLMEILFLAAENKTVFNGVVEMLAEHKKKIDWLLSKVKNALEQTVKPYDLSKLGPLSERGVLWSSIADALLLNIETQKRLQSSWLQKYCTIADVVVNLPVECEASVGKDVLKYAQGDKDVLPKLMKFTESEQQLFDVLLEYGAPLCNIETVYQRGYTVDSAAIHYAMVQLLEGLGEPLNYSYALTTLYMGTKSRRVGEVVTKEELMPEEINQLRIRLNVPAVLLGEIKETVKLRTLADGGKPIFNFSATTTDILVSRLRLEQVDLQMEQVKQIVSNSASLLNGITENTLLKSELEKKCQGILDILTTTEVGV